MQRDTRKKDKDSLNNKERHSQRRVVAEIKTKRNKGWKKDKDPNRSTHKPG